MRKNTIENKVRIKREKDLLLQFNKKDRNSIIEI